MGGIISASSAKIDAVKNRFKLKVENAMSNTSTDKYTMSSEREGRQDAVFKLRYTTIEKYML